MINTPRPDKRLATPDAGRIPAVVTFPDDPFFISVWLNNDEVPGGIVGFALDDEQATGLAARLLQTVHERGGGNVTAILSGITVTPAPAQIVNSPKARVLMHINNQPVTAGLYLHELDKLARDATEFMRQFDDPDHWG